MDENSCDGFPVLGVSGESDANSSTSSSVVGPEARTSRRSTVWQYFTSVDQYNSKCNACGKILRSVSGATTSMLRHARTHPDFFGLEDRQVGSEQAMNRNSPRAEELTNAIAKLMVWDLEPYSVVDRKGFKYLLSILEPSYKPPSRTTFSREVIPRLYEAEVQRIKGVIANDVKEGVSSVAFTTDGWTSRAVENYISLTVHYVTVHFERRQFTLGISSLVESHTSVNLHNVLQNLIHEWGLDHAAIESSFFITDNAPNIVAAIRLNRAWCRIPCFAHTLQLAVKDSVKKSAAFKEVCRKAQAIVGFFARSTTGHEKLTQAQKNLEPEKKALKLIQNVDTRWNSEHDMMARLLALRRPLSLVLCERGMPTNFDDSEWEVLREYVEILEPVKEATALMSGEKYPTLSQYFPVVEALKKASKDDTGDMDVDLEENAVDLRSSLYDALTSRFNFVNSRNDSLIFAMILDPRFKDRFITTDVEKFEVSQRLKWKTKLRTGEDNEEDDEQAGATSRSDATGEPKSKLLKLFDEVLETPRDSKKDVECELTQYLREKVVPRDTQVLAWWNTNKSAFPLLAEMARKYLNIPASQTTSERLFSTAGNIVTPNRAQLLTSHVEQLAFLHENC